MVGDKLNADSSTRQGFLGVDNCLFTLKWPYAD